MVHVGVRKDAARHGRDLWVFVLHLWHPQRPDGVPRHPVPQVEVAKITRLLVVNLPQAYGLVVGGQQVQAVPCAAAPLDAIDLFLYFQRLQIVELWLVALKFIVEIVLAQGFSTLARARVLSRDLLFEYNYSSSLVAGR